MSFGDICRVWLAEREKAENGWEAGGTDGDESVKIWSDLMVRARSFIIKP